MQPVARDHRGAELGGWIDAGTRPSHQRGVVAVGGLVSRGEGALTAVVCRECRTLQLQLRLDGLVSGRRCVGGRQTVIKKQSRHVLATRIATMPTIRRKLSWRP